MRIYNEDILIENINRLMKENNMTQNDLETAIHFSQPAISKMFNKKQNLTVEFVFAVADYFDVTIDSLCQKYEAKPPAPENTSTKVTTYEVCSSLATIFKSCYPNTKQITYKETAYLEQTDDYGDGIGLYYPVNDRENSYISIFFSNYCPINYSFESRAEFEEDQELLQEFGNEHTQNMIINQFISQLTDLLDTFRKGSLEYEPYIQAINAKLAKIEK